jgi:Asp-tRNA(Asn)/Glu-tRNA(Gln) amidotransferase A subunit family amidase
MKTIDKEITDIATVHQHIQMGELSPVDFVEKCLIRIEQLNPNLNAFITVLGKQALEQARIAEDEIKSTKYRGPLHGIPIGIKDFYDTAGIKTTAAFEPFKGRVPQALAADNTIFANYYGLPAISIPCGFAQNGLPMGIQIVGKPWGEVNALHLAYRFEQLKLSSNELG